MSRGIAFAADEAYARALQVAVSSCAAQLPDRTTFLVADYGLTDASRLRQIVEHLVENAVKYAPSDTMIRIDWGLVEGFVHLGVTDEGPGIPDEWRERIFEPYARRETHTARGSGIGLYAAKRLGESMGCHLWCEPATPHGARFVVAVPAAAAI